MADISLDGFCHRATVSLSRNGGIGAAEAQAHFDRGIAWAQIGAYEQALDALRQALRLPSDPAYIYAAMGSVYMTLGCWQEAIRSYQLAILADPHLPESYYGLGSAYGRLGEYGCAIEAYQQAFRHLPNAAAPAQEAVVFDREGTTTGEASRESDAFQDRLRAETEGFDFTALLSTPTARRQAARQEPTPTRSALPLPQENAFRQETFPQTTHGSIGILHATPALDTALAPDSDISDEEEEYEVAPPRDRRARAILVVLLIVLGCMGGRMMLAAVNEARDRAAYLAASRASHTRGGGLTEPPAVGRGSQ